MSEKIIKNRKKQDIHVLVELKENSKGLVFIEHGLGGHKEQKHIITIADAFKEKNFSVIRFDTTNSFGKSDGQFENATTTSYYEDLEDVISWSSKKNWYNEPFILAGHSTGGICIMLYAAKFPEKVMAIAPISTVISGKLDSKTKWAGDLEKWKKEGVKIWRSNSGETRKLKWNYIEDELKYDILQKIERIKMPVLLVVGENDIATPVEHHKILSEKLNSKKEFHIIKGSEHTFREPNELKELKQIIKNWIETI